MKGDGVTSAARAPWASAEGVRCRAAGRGAVRLRGGGYSLGKGVAAGPLDPHLRAPTPDGRTCRCTGGTQL